MDQVLADTLTANLKSAKTADAKMDALTLAMIAVVDCQRKTSDRVKKFDRILWLGRTVQGFVAGGGFALIVKVMKVVGML